MQSRLREAARWCRTTLCCEYGWIKRLWLSQDNGLPFPLRTPGGQHFGQQCQDRTFRKGCLTSFLLLFKIAGPFLEPETSSTVSRIKGPLWDRAPRLSSSLFWFQGTVPACAFPPYVWAIPLSHLRLLCLPRKLSALRSPRPSSFPQRCCSSDQEPLAVSLQDRASLFRSAPVTR